ncbi:MAG: 30S ribosome-binding factor RbfA [Oscillospiraceae bacterium]|nr:30S ribosome-binding factor RbfA [Oscillospiraceae bacterium]
MSDRIDKINDEVLKALSQAVRSLKDPRLDGKFYTLTRADVSRDFSYAKIHVSVMGNASAQDSVMAGLSSAAGLLRRELGKAVVLHKTPEISFIADNSLAHSERINEVLDKVLPKNDA